MRKCCGVVRFPGVRLTHGGPAEKRGFLREAIFVRKSLSCLTSEIRTRLIRSELARRQDASSLLNATVKTGLFFWDARLLETAKGERIRPEFLPRERRFGMWEATVDALAYSQGS